jgi:hypothetical protein
VAVADAIVLLVLLVLLLLLLAPPSAAPGCRRRSRLRMPPRSNPARARRSPFPPC